MSDSGNDAGASASPGVGLAFTEREMQMLAWAMQSLKSGPPDVDYAKLANYAGMTNPRSAGNAWTKIRNKLNSATGDGTALTTPKKAPQKKKAAAEKADEADGDAAGNDATPKKSTPRKRTPKKQEVDGEAASPKKRGRPTGAKNKKATDDAESTPVKTEAADEKVDEMMEDADAEADLKPEAAAATNGEAAQEEI
ncbi:uncharacterized protein N0V89_011688 [Didymosphaeria variabile]|uniref:Myb-like domain-containing protein n=1 Tax=Didymosphaeria variabile TaxID=1932322 RepID=A0A9W9C5L6_9PLEO|nr:uncharacterized protein N0V89_011688 [Didymosphaeria variabile]KAJ4345555.1 hypothetical protein N0V89_011688 [Didymosphaeria variabile]